MNETEQETIQKNAGECIEKKSNWRTILFRIVFSIMIILIGLYFFAIVNLTEKIANKTNNTYVNYNLDSIRNSIDIINKRIDNLQNQLINKALIDINASDFQVIDDNLFLLVRDVKPYSSGYKFTFGILNKSGIDMSNLKFVIRTDNLTKEFTLNGQLKNQYLNNVDVIIPNISKDDLSNKNWYVQFINASYSFYDMTKTNK